MAPSWVFLMALERKLNSTCVILFRSTIIQISSSGRITFNRMPVFIFRRCTFSTSSISPVISTNWKFISDFPDSMRERSRMSFMSCNNRLLFFWMMFRYSAFSTSSSVKAMISENPTIAFKGVRISWLILARNTDFMRSASSARCFASMSSLERCTLSPISCINAITLLSSNGAMRAWK